jgi:molecular chaperone GrpE
VVNKFLPVIDNLRRALEAERSMEASESAEFRHFLHGVELINKQLDEVLESFGVQAVPAVGEPFDPHVHEAVVTEPTSEYEPDTVIQEIVRGYRLGDKLLRPAMVKVATGPSSD